MHYTLQMPIFETTNLFIHYSWIGWLITLQIIFYQEKEQYKQMAKKHCSFLYDNYTNILIGLIDYMQSIICY